MCMLPHRNCISQTVLVAAVASIALAIPAYAQNAPALLPPTLKSAGKLVVGIEATYPPMAYKDPQTNKRKGVNVDLVEAIAKELGIAVQWEEMTFEQLAPALTTGRINMIGTALTDIPSRREKLTFVDYLQTGAQPFALAAQAEAIKTSADLCGKTIGTPRTTSYFRITNAWNERNCTAAGKPAMTVNGTHGATATRTDLKQGRIDVAILGPEYVAYLMADESGVYALAGAPLSTTYFGLAFERKDVMLRDAVSAAVTATMKSGAYQQILQTHGVSKQAMTEIRIDAGQ